ncbi:Polycystic kidney disease protein 1-like 3 [Actinoplanes sp. SE50]|uniref:hypothetical protein n=1 Tax=unclassified Actinoplanes TaxID=2626549 RepID=UPI00023ECE25|nr:MULTISPECIES: hypothetical protein [unclassified Actinoplanes]AEV82698.1 Polycystic kidney disease protein 1-like 3 [Actinoplanes sp. SE50/110]ATO81094.1 Polycystic kidney disease protein 1-like 3 [Actinoplanes sp. SE50]SLL98501.1 polycystic kidney disease 1-like 3 [Actinoplanes sp. SE50/110]
MEPTSSPDNPRPAPGLARFWQVRPHPDSAAEIPVAAPTEHRRPVDPLELGLPTDLLTGASMAFSVRGASPFGPVAAADGPHGANGSAGEPGDPPAGDPFGLNRAASRGPGAARGDHSGRPPARSRHGDSDHSTPSDPEPEGTQDVESQEPAAGSPVRETSFGGFRLGGTGRFLFGGRTHDAQPGVNGHGPAEESSAAEETPGDAQVAEAPVDEESTGTAPEDEPADDAPPEAGQDTADAAERDENGREHMNGRAGAPGYAQAPDMPGPAEAPAADGPLDDAAEPHPAAGWASVPVPPPTSGAPAGSTGPVSGAPVSPGYAPAPYLATDFTPDHPAVPEPTAAEQPAHDPAASAAPVSPAQPGFPPFPPAPPATGSASVPAPDLRFPLPPAAPPTPATPQIPASRTPVDQPPAAPDTSFAFGSPATTGYSLGRSGEVYGVASVTPAGPSAPQPGSVTPPPLEFQPFPESGLSGISVGTGRRGRTDDAPHGAPDGTPLDGTPLDGAADTTRGLADETLRGASGNAGRGLIDDVYRVPAPDAPRGLTDEALRSLADGELNRGLTDGEPGPAARRSASLEDAEPVRRPGRRAVPDTDDTGLDGAAGDEESAAVIRPTVWDEDAARHFRAAWHEVKAEFVDDPVNALTRAHDLLTDAVNELTEVLLAERDDLDPLRGTDTPDTESMRMAMRGYREFLERILSL